MKFIVFSVALVLTAGTALASMGSGSGGGGGGSAGANANAPQNSPLALKCKKGKVAKKNKAGKLVCVDLEGSDLPDGDLYHQGWVLAKAGEFDWAIQVLSAVKNQNQADVQTMLGYSNRKSGKTDLGLSYYYKALSLNPNYAPAHEYLGEGYVSLHLMDSAKKQLEELQRICGGTSCEEYKDLSEAIGQGGT